MDYQSIQKNVFHYIMSKIGKSKACLIKEICQILPISQSAAYKRWRGEQPLIYPDILCLKNHYDIPIEVLLTNDKDITPLN
jgi:hypothetical protein